MNWKNIFEDELLNEYNNQAFDKCLTELENGTILYPYIEKNEDGKITTDFYRALDLTAFENVKVVILGQDPYHEKGQANGLAFSVYNGVKMPPSLRNIFKELQDDLGGELRTNTDLTDWAKQGVLLLNTSLSVIEGKANSMAPIWEPMTDRLIELIDANKKPVIFVLWGGNAQKKKRLINNNKEHIIESAHPSPLSAYRGFFGSKPFSKINDALASLGIDEIKWN